MFPKLLFSAIAARVTPGFAALEPSERRQCLEISERCLAAKPLALRLQVRAFLQLIRWAPLLRFGAAFEGLAGDRQDRVLRRLQDSSWRLLRSGFWGLKVLIFMGYYGRRSQWPRVGYRPSLKGNELLHAGR